MSTKDPCSAKPNTTAKDTNTATSAASVSVNVSENVAASQTKSVTVSSATTATKNNNKNNNNNETKKRKHMSVVLDQIIYAIRALQNGPRGSSRVAIVKYIGSEFDHDHDDDDDDDATFINKALKLGIQNGRLTRPTSSSSHRFCVAEGKPTTTTTTADPANAPPQISIQDFVVGSSGGPVATHQDVVTIQYVGLLEEDGSEFDSAKSFTFLLGAEEVIKGMDLGVMGMQIGGKRKITIPSKLGFGKRGSPPDIPKNANLQFEVTLKKLERT